LRGTVHSWNVELIGRQSLFTVYSHSRPPPPSTNLLFSLAIRYYRVLIKTDRK